MCAIHQPTLFPRLSTLAKLYAADVWIVLDDVQFARRDYQHRTRLAALDDPARRQWLSLATHLPQGRATLIRNAGPRAALGSAHGCCSLDSRDDQRRTLRGLPGLGAVRP